MGLTITFLLPIYTPLSMSSAFLSLQPCSPFIILSPFLQYNHGDQTKHRQQLHVYLSVLISQNKWLSLPLPNFSHKSYIKVPFIEQHKNTDGRDEKECKGHWEYYQEGPALTHSYQYSSVGAHTHTHLYSSSLWKKAESMNLSEKRLVDCGVSTYPSNSVVVMEVIQIPPLPNFFLFSSGPFVLFMTCNSCLNTNNRSCQKKVGVMNSSLSSRRGVRYLFLKQIFWFSASIPLQKELENHSKVSLFIKSIPTIKKKSREIIITCISL